MLHSQGKLHYHSKWLMLYTDDEIGRYYRALFKTQEPWIRFNLPMHGTHITVVPGKYETPPKMELWGKYEGEIIDFTYDNDVTNLGNYYWLRVYCPRIEDIREELGLPRTLPVPWHMTIGNTKGLDESS